VTEAVTLGFGDESLAGVVRSDAGALIHRDGATGPARPARVRTLAGDAGWAAADDDGLDVVLEPLGPPATYPDGTREWLCRARGTVDGVAVDCLGHAVVEAPGPRGRRRPALSRAVAAWLDDELAIGLRARRPARARDHEAEEVAGFVVRGSAAEPQPIDDPRLSTAYGGDGRHRRAGLELWETEESDYPLRLAGEAIGGGELELEGGMRLRSAFFVWHYAGRAGAGRYDIVIPGG
jgi:hypothetical protein